MMKEELEILQNVLKLEADSLVKAAEKFEPALGEQIIQVFEEVVRGRGSLFVCGVGKSGLIARKISSTFSSLGLPSFFLDPNEALHGDLGRVREEDGLIVISNSGTTEEILKLLPHIPVPQSRIIGLLGNLKSPLATFSAVNIDCGVTKEASLSNLAPTSSSTVALAVGDALAVLFEKYSMLTKEKFARNHPAGKLGKSLSLKVSHLMIPAEDCAIVSPQSTIKEMILEMTKKPVNGCSVCEEGVFKGLVVEGDIRRFLIEDKNLLDKSVKEMMNSEPITIKSDILAIEALEIMEKRKRPLNVLPVVDDNKFLGFLRLHDLIKEGFSS